MKSPDRSSALPVTSSIGELMRALRKHFAGGVLSITVLLALTGCTSTTDTGEPKPPNVTVVTENPDGNATTVILVDATATPEPKPTATVTPETTNVDGSPVEPDQQNLVNAITDRLEQLRIINPKSIRVTINGSEVTFEVTVAEIAPDGTIKGLPVGSLLVVDTAQTPDVENLTSADVLTLTADGALAVSLTGLPEEVVDQVRASLEDSAGWKLIYDQGRAEVKTSDGQLIAFADKDTGNSWQPGQVLVNAVDQSSDGWQWNEETNSWVGGAGTGGPIDFTVTPESATATAEPAATAEPTLQPTETLVPPATATPPPATEAPTVATTEAVTEVESPEHVKAMENVRKWLSGEMQVPDDNRFRTYLGELQPYGRLGGDQERGQSSDLATVESYSGIVLGWEQLPNGDVVAFFGFEDSLGNRFVAPIRIGRNETAGNIIALVDSYANVAAGDNRDTHVFVSPLEVGLKLDELIGKQVIIGTITSFKAEPDQLPNVNPDYIREIINQCLEASTFDSAFRKLAVGTSFTTLEEQEKSLFTYTDASHRIPELMLGQLDY